MAPQLPTQGGSAHFVVQILLYVLTNFVSSLEKVGRVREMTSLSPREVREGSEHTGCHFSVFLQFCVF